MTFTEVWDARSFRKEGSATTGPQAHIWQFTVDEDGRILDRVQFGDFPPQFVM